MIKLLQSLGNIKTEDEQIELLRKLVGYFRPIRSSAPDYSEKALLEFIKLLEREDTLREDLKKVVHALILSSDIVKLLTNNGLLSNRGFIQELKHKITTKILPEVYPRNSIEYKIDILFYKKTDVIWIRKISDQTWVKLFRLLNFDDLNEEKWQTEQLLQAITVLSYKLAGLGLEKEIAGRFEDNSAIILPYLEQNKLVNKLQENYNTSSKLFNSESEDLRQLSVMLNQCSSNIEGIRKKRLSIGTSLEQTFILERMRQLIQRMRLLLKLLLQEDNQRDFVPLFKKLIRNEKQKTEVIPFVRQNISLLAYQVSEHEGNTGEHYITTTTAEYRNFFFSSTGGGFIAGLMAFTKTLLHHLPLAPFWTAFSYSLNYASGFILIHISGSTLATKQPAMTASAIANALDDKKNQEVSLENLAIVIARTSRSQFISLLGNLCICFPLGFLMALVYPFISGQELVSNDEALKMLHDIHPWQSAALFFAGIAGIYLFLGGIISGYYDNLVLYSHIPERIKKMPLFLKILGKKTTNRFSDYIQHNLGSLAGNFFLGGFLGSTAIFAGFFGLGLDIRHVTISSANFGIILYEVGHYLSYKTIAIGMLGLMGIGFMNLLVSFGLAFLIAIWSRGISIGQYAQFLGYLKTYFFKYPQDFFFPPAKTRTVEDVWPDQD